MLQHASWLLLALNLFHVKEIHIFTLQTCCQPIIQFVLIGRSPSSFGHLPRQSYSPKIVRAGGPLRVAVGKKRHIFDLFFFFAEDSPNNKQSPEGEWQCKHYSLHSSVLNNCADIGAFRWYTYTYVHTPTQTHSLSFSFCLTAFSESLISLFLFGLCSLYF